MFQRLFLLAMLGMGIILTSGGEVHAQYNPGRYFSPSGPTITPYLDYFRQDNGLLNPYYNFVRPRFQLQSDLQQVNSVLWQQQANQQKLAEGFVQQRAAGATPTGKSATFMNYSHYYPQSGRSGLQR